MTTFGDNGLATVGFDATGVSVHCVLETSSGLIVLGGQGNNGLFTGYAWATIEGNGTTPIQPVGAFRVAGSSMGDVRACTQAGDTVYMAAVANAGSSSFAATLKLVKNGASPTYTPDTSFSVIGEASTQLGAGIDNGSDGFHAHQQADGKVVLAGRFRDPVDYKSFYLYRWEANGQKDTTFGPSQDGRVVTPAPGATFAAEAHAAFTQADGKIVAIGLIDGKVAAMRYSPTGALDATFGTAGVLTSSFTADGFGYEPETQRVVGFRKRTNEKLMLTRVKNDGTLDTSFGGTGQVMADAPADFVPTDLAVAADGRILVTGSTNAAKAIVLGFTAAGAVDTAFGTAGVATFDLSGKLKTYGGERLGRTKDGKLLLAGLGVEAPSGTNAKAFVIKIDL